MIWENNMKKIFKTKLQKGLFIAAVVLTVITGFFAYTCNDTEKCWVNKDYEDYVSDKDFYEVTSVPIKSFKTLSGFNDSSLTHADLYRVCIVDITFKGGQTMKFYIPRSSKDKIGNIVEVAYAKHWDTEYDRIMDSSDIDENSILNASRTQKVRDGFFARIFTFAAIAFCAFAVSVFFVCYKNKDSYDF